MNKMKHFKLCWLCYSKIALSKDGRWHKNCITIRMPSDIFNLDHILNRSGVRDRNLSALYDLLNFLALFGTVSESSNYSMDFHINTCLRKHDKDNNTDNYYC